MYKIFCSSEEHSTSHAGNVASTVCASRFRLPAVQMFLSEERFHSASSCTSHIDLDFAAYAVLCSVDFVRKVYTDSTFSASDEHFTFF